MIMLSQLVKYADMIGIIGVVLVLVAYYLLSTNKLSSRNLSYPLLNLIGAFLILYSLLFNWNLASVVIEMAWILISVIGLYRIAQGKKLIKDMRSNLHVIGGK
ncbi:MAG: hypothetical protein A3F14_01185 [Gammaproteobacteria bacterium RIFCSPHIGHO2_12_FULL_43_28]|nr:MAG: hypothetical protein A3F14_01185 [Gammaproteobacteria bacterium RIFCSPHIGHO2_12_FULL_43_28]